MNRALDPGPSYLVLFLIFGLTLGAESLLWSRVQAFIDTKSEERIALLKGEAVTDALVMSESVSRTLDQINTLHGLARLVTEARRIGDPPMEKAARNELSLWRGRMEQGVQQIGGIALNGYLDWTNFEHGFAPVYLGDREHFQAIVAGAEHFIGRPVIGRVSHEPTIDFTRAVRAPDGTLRSVTVVSIAPTLLSGLASKIGISGTDTMMVLRRDGIILARASGDAGRTGAANAAHMRAFLGAPSGLTEGISSVDGVNRIVAWQRLDNAGLIVVVGLDPQARMEQFQPTLDKAYHWLALTEILIAILGGSSVLLVRWRRQAGAAEARSAMIRESESLFRQMAESLPDLIRLLDRDGIVTYASPSARDILGVSPERLVGQRSDVFVHPEDADKLVAPGVPDLPEGSHRRSEVRLIRPDGQIIWVETTLRLVNLDGRSGMIVSASRDVTRHHAAERALQRAKEELDAILTATLSTIFRSRIQPDGSVRLVFVSESAINLVGYTPAEMIEDPKWFANHFDPAFAGEQKAHLRRALAEGSSRIKYRLQHKNGEWLWVSLFVRRVKGEDGMTMVGTATNVTMEHERDVLLAQHAKLALLGEMTTGIAHELNQPLTAIGMMVENGLEGLDPSDPRHEAVGGKLTRIREQVRRASTVIDHMRIFGRKPGDAPTPVAVADAIEGATALLEGRLTRADTTVSRMVDPDVPPILGHLVLLEQVLVNLLANAADAIETHQPPLPPERRRIEIRASQVSGMVEITVADRAGGITDGVLQRIFDPFFTTKPVGSGTGLGLSISYGIVTEMGGVISARNQDDGTLFQIRLSPVTATDTKRYG